MTCDEVNTFIEAIAVGDAVPDPIRGHVAACPRCARRLVLAQRIEAVLASRPVAEATTGFTPAVMARLRHDRWRSEQVVDVGFNIAVAAGALLIVAGIAGLVWRSGVLQIGGDVATLLLPTVRSVAARIATDARVIMIATLLLSTAVGLWWWAEEDARA